jgi:DnaK suppressor protein
MPFSKDFLMMQKSKLLNHKIKVMTTMKESYQTDVIVNSEDTVEDGDQAQIYVNQNVSFSLQENSIKTLHDIESALEKIENGNYGICEETGDPIDQKRLEKQPWVRLSLEAQEELEREQKKFYKSA